MGLFGDIKSAVGLGGGDGESKPSPRQQLRQQTERARSLGKKIAGAKEGGRRAKRLGRRQERLSGRMERTYATVQARREKRHMPTRQIGTARMERRSTR